jgi:protein-tyrosine phosphatase
MDADNLKNLNAMGPSNFSGQLKLLLDFSSKPEYQEISEVPDPYYGGEDGFPLVLDLIEDACASLLNHIRTQIDA